MSIGISLKIIFYHLSSSWKSSEGQFSASCLNSRLRSLQRKTRSSTSTAENSIEVRKQLLSARLHRYKTLQNQLNDALHQNAVSCLEFEIDLACKSKFWIDRHWAMRIVYWKHYINVKILHWLNTKVHKLSYRDCWTHTERSCEFGIPNIKRYFCRTEN